MLQINRRKRAWLAHNDRRAHYEPAEGHQTELSSTMAWWRGMCLRGRFKSMLREAEKASLAYGFGALPAESGFNAVDVNRDGVIDRQEWVSRAKQ